MPSPVLWPCCIRLAGAFPYTCGLFLPPLLVYTSLYTKFTALFTTAKLLLFWRWNSANIIRKSANTSAFRLFPLLKVRLLLLKLLLVYFSKRAAHFSTAARYFSKTSHLLLKLLLIPNQPAPILVDKRLGRWVHCRHFVDKMLTTAPSSAFSEFTTRFTSHVRIAFAAYDFGTLFAVSAVVLCGIFAGGVWPVLRFPGFCGGK